MNNDALICDYCMTYNGVSNKNVVSYYVMPGLLPGLPFIEKRCSLHALIDPNWMEISFSEYLIYQVWCE